MKSVQDAIRDKQEKFLFAGVEISLTPTVGLFITMNPGYAGRTELPENLKALFRYIYIYTYLYQSQMNLHMMCTHTASKL